MDRRAAMKALGSVAASAGMTIVPVTTTDATEAHLVMLKTQRLLSAEVSQRLATAWKVAVQGTSLEHVKVIVLEQGLDVEIVRK